jgi:betaine-aldehyde dehydrogenase
VRASAGNLKRVSLELGGKSPQIVRGDADLDAVVFGVFFNSGQCCNSSSRLIVEASVAESFLSQVEALTLRVRVGDPLDPDTRIGAIVNQAQMVAREEIFGPVLSVITFHTLDEAIWIANDTHYGLSAGIWTESYRAASKAGRELSAGTVGVNTWMDRFPEMPFGGMRQSGVGREQGPDAINELTETKSILLHQGPRLLWVPGTRTAERG